MGKVLRFKEMGESDGRWDICGSRADLFTRRSRFLTFGTRFDAASRAFGMTIDFPILTIINLW